MKRLNCYVNLSIALLMTCTSSAFSQGSQSAKAWQLDKMPADLETEYALSALPPHLRESATVYLLDPNKGYYVARKGTNGFATFVDRTDWEWGEFVQDIYAPISYDPEGVKTYLPVFFAVAEMRASGKYSAAQIRDTILKRVKNGIYKAPTRNGVSYMLGPIMRSHLDSTSGIVSMVMPHFMFYAPRVDNSDIGGEWDGHTPYAINSGDNLDKQHSIFDYIIIPAGDKEKAKILEDDKDLIQRLAAYKACLKVDMMDMGH